MKNILTKASLLALAAIPALTSCDDVAEADRLIPIDRVDAQKSVLVVEFTGQLCVNCPRGAQVVHGLMEQYPGNVISVNLHPKNTAFTKVPPKYDIGLTSDIATEYYMIIQPMAFPAALIDFRTPPNDDTSSWAEAVETALKETAPGDIAMNAAFDESTRQLDVEYQVNFTHVYQGDPTVLLWVTENNIVGYQVGASKPLEYVHNHVLRASMNGTWGETLEKTEGYTEFIPDVNYTGKASIQIPEEWVAENLNVVAVLLDANHTSLQVIEIPACTNP